ncbi:MAG TPA: hydantoinase B/oxoprolinase family protein [Candidatus Angelobacter sp.]|nr:hydantoinase B/oxoprolinase family protein [Candidatus Angelobacter sp.]
MRDPVELEIFKNIFHSIAEEMGAALRRTAFSPNIKERRDYSCAVFDSEGEVVAMGDHMPVHLGSMPMSVRAAIETLQLNPGDVAVLNDPFCGGTHLPDVTLVAPVFPHSGVSNLGLPKTQTKAKAISVNGPRAQKSASVRNGDAARQAKAIRAHSPASKVKPGTKPYFYVASRAHHADVGGTYAGSMGICREIYQEGLRIPPIKLIESGQLQKDVFRLLLSNVRTPEEREGDLNAQIAACHTGAARLLEIVERYGLPRVRLVMDELQDYSERMMRTFLSQVPPGRYAAEDFLDDDGVGSGPVRIAVTLEFHKASAGKPLVTVDFTGSSPQVAGSINAVEAITYSACFYVFRCLLVEDVPAAAGLMRPVRLIAPLGSVVNSHPPAAVAGGNVETSQRIVDVLLRALAHAMPSRIPAGSSGTMNNLTIGGIDQRTGEPFAYYETIAGGMGARPDRAGVSGVHTHMTNSLNTPAEALEYAYPLRVTQYSLRRNSGGKGKFQGGDGIIREIELLTDAEVTLLADRRTRGPYGLDGASDGAPGVTEVVRSNGQRERLPGKTSLRLKKGERIRIESPGGGGH